MHTPLVVLGGGPGGYAAAFLAADLGLETIIVEADDHLGGTCLLRGCIPSKALLHVADVVAQSRHASQWGVEFERLRIDLPTLRSRNAEVINTLAKGLEQMASRRGVHVVHARGRFVDSGMLSLTNSDKGALEDDTISFNHCIVATGSLASIPEPLRLDSKLVMSSNEALRLEVVPPTLLVIGGGYIGLEMGTLYARLGSDVTIVEMTDRLLPAADADLVEPLAKKLGYLFREIRLMTRVVAMKARDSHVEVSLNGPNGTSTASFDRVLVAVGRKPATSDIGLENTNVVVDRDGFIAVDQCQRTHDSKILAIGDVVGEPMLAHKATHQGKVAAETLVHGSAAFDNRAIPAVVFTDPEIAWAGLTAEKAKHDGQSVREVRFPWNASGRAATLGRTEGLTKWIIDTESDRVLGCGIVGVGAGELIAEAVVAIETGCTVRDVADSIHPHPTLSETLGVAAEMDLGTATDIYRPPSR